MIEKESRPSWGTYFMNITNLVAERSTCTRRAVGTVLVKEKRILSTGYNGAPNGLKHCLEVGCLREQLGADSLAKELLGEAGIEIMQINSDNRGEGS